MASTGRILSAARRGLVSVSALPAAGGEPLHACAADAATAAAGAAALSLRRAYHDGPGGHSGGGGGGFSPLHGHPLGHIPPASLTPPGLFGYHATTILSVRKGGKVVRTAKGAAGVGDGEDSRGADVGCYLRCCAASAFLGPYGRRRPQRAHAL